MIAAKMKYPHMSGVISSEYGALSQVLQTRNPSIGGAQGPQSEILLSLKNLFGAPNLEITKFLISHIESSFVMKIH